MGELRDLQTQIEEMNMIRILQPELAQKMLLLLAQRPGLNNYILQHENQIYFSLSHLTSSSQRERTYNQLMALQIGEKIDFQQLPRPFNDLLAPPQPQMNKLATAFIVGSGSGIILGILAMAIVELVLAIGGFSHETGIGLGISAISFLVFAVLGSLGSSIIAWKQVNLQPRP